MDKPSGNSILGFGAFLVVLPFILLALYWHPVGTHGFDWISNWNGQFDEVSWWAQQQYWYTTTMGRYASSALLSTTAYWYSLPIARVVIGLSILALPTSLYYLFTGIFPKVNRREIITLSMVCAAIWLGQLSNPYDSLYRWSGMMTYQFGLIASLLFVGSIVRQRFWLASVFAILTVGTNEISLLQCGLLLAGYLLWSHRSLLSTSVLTLLVVAALSAAVSLMAPGNWVRAEAYLQPATEMNISLLILASGAYLSLGYLLNGGIIILSIWLISSDFQLELARKKVWLLSIAILVFPTISIAPVILATRGDSLPEGITDWQILPFMILLVCITASLPTIRMNSTLRWGLSLALILPLLGTGLSIDRSRDKVINSPFDRIEVVARAGNAWKQLVSGRATQYNLSVNAQYEAIKGCEAAACVIPPLTAQTDNYLYDPSYDRRLKGSECCMGSAVGKPGVSARYNQ